MPVPELSTSDHALLLEHYKPPHYPLQGGSHSLEGISLLWPPLPGKPLKATLFYVTPNAVSLFLFGEQSLSYGNRFNV